MRTVTRLVLLAITLCSCGQPIDDNERAANHFSGELDGVPFSREPDINYDDDEGGYLELISDPDGAEAFMVGLVFLDGPREGSGDIGGERDDVFAIGCYREAGRRTWTYDDTARDGSYEIDGDKITFTVGMPDGSVVDGRAVFPR